MQINHRPKSNLYNFALKPLSIDFFFECWLNIRDGIGMLNTF